VEERRQGFGRRRNPGYHRRPPEGQRAGRRIIEEPLGGAQRDWDAMFQSMRRALTDTLTELRKQSTDALLTARYQRLRAYGSFKETPAK
jgi:hypothetical protein